MVDKPFENRRVPQKCQVIEEFSSTSNFGYLPPRALVISNNFPQSMRVITIILQKTEKGLKRPIFESNEILGIYATLRPSEITHAGIRNYFLTSFSV